MFKDIKDELIEKGYFNKKISYAQLNELYMEYNIGLSEETFAKEILGISINRYRKVKKSGENVIVFRSKNVEDEVIDKIVEKLKQDGYSMKKINYSQLKELHKLYGKKLTESIFAQKVLKLTYGNYRACKENKGKIVIILKGEGDITNVKNILVEDGYANTMLHSYSEFKQLYNKYGNEFSESEFAESILGISIDNYRLLKSKNLKLRILTEEINEEGIKKIKSELKKNGYKNKSINYSEFQELYSKFGEKFKNESQFAEQVLNVSNDSYKYAKLRNGKMVVLKDKFKKIEDVDEIKQELIKEGYLNKSVDYSEIQQLHKKYGNRLTEKEFALEILEISIDSYRLTKSGKDNSKILKRQVQKQVEKIKQQLRDDGFENKQVYYEEIKKLHQRYGVFLTERQFAKQLLQLTYSNYDNAKRGIKVTILREKDQLSKSEIENVRQRLKDDGFEDAMLTYEDIEELYIIYGKGLTKRTFYKEVLGILGKNIPKKESGRRTKVLRKKDKLSIEEIENLKQELKGKGYYETKIISDDVKKLYNQFGEGLTYETFLEEVLGITKKQVLDANQKKGKVRIIDKRTKIKMEQVKNMYLTDNRYYSKDEVYRICKDSEINIEDFIIYSLVRTVEHNQKKYIQTYMEILEENEKLWIGNGRVSKECIDKNYQEIEEQINKVILSVKKVYPYAYKYSEDKRDDFQELFMFFLQNGQEIEKNFIANNNSLWKRYMFGKLKRHLLITIYSRIGWQKKEITIVDKEKKDIDIKDDSINIEEVVYEKLEQEQIQIVNRCIQELGKALESGKKRNEARELVKEKLNLTDEEILQCMEKYIEINHVMGYSSNEIEDSDDEYPGK